MFGEPHTVSFSGMAGWPGSHPSLPTSRSDSKIESMGTQFQADSLEEAKAATGQEHYG